MKIERDKSPAEPAQPSEFEEGVDYYFEDGLMVLTAAYLLKRGCCGNGCRHCPYSEDKQSIGNR
jgi:hypothetical protein